MGKEGKEEAPIPARVAAALKGAIVADAASMGTHWIYDLEELKSTVTSADAPEFRDPPSPKFYSAEEYPGHYGPGMLSPMGEQLLFFAEYCGKHKCVTAGHVSVQFKQWAETWGGRKDHATKEFLTCMKAADRSVELIGEEDKEAHCFAKLIPVVCLYAGEVDMLERVKEAIMAFQTNKEAIRFGMAAAALLESVLCGHTLQESLEKVVSRVITTSGSEDVMDACLRALCDAKLKTFEELLEGLKEEELGGASCALPSPFIANMYLFYKAVADGTVDEAAYIKAIRENIMGGGDTCGRAILLGAVLGASAEKVPESFVEKTDKEVVERIDTAIKEIIEAL